MGETMKEFNEKRVYMTMEISITCKEEIERIIKNKEISKAHRPDFVSSLGALLYFQIDVV